MRKREGGMKRGSERESKTEMERREGVKYLRIKKKGQGKI